MKSARVFLPIVLLSLFGVVAPGCKEEPPPPLPEPAPSATTQAVSAKSRLAMRSPVAQVPKVDPQTLKTYRVDLCYVGAMTLRQARDAYLASLGKAEPSAKKIPNFGASPASAAAAGVAPPAPAKTDLAVPAAASPKPGTSAAAAPGAKAPLPPNGIHPALPVDARRPATDLALRAPHERNARACTAAAAMKDPAMEGIDPALAEYAPFVVELAKKVVSASTYYQREEFKTDAFAKGKELHKGLLADFERLDAMSAKLGLALDTWAKAHPPDTKAMDEGQKLTLAALDDARMTFTLLLPAKVDVEAYKAAVAKLEKSAEALKALGTSAPTDPWPKIMTASLDAYIRTLKGIEEKLTDKGATPDAFLNAVTGMTSVIESKHRALTRSLIAKQRKDEAAQTVPGASGAPSVPAAPAAPDSQE